MFDDFFDSFGFENSTSDSDGIFGDSTYKLTETNSQFISNQNNYKAIVIDNGSFEIRSGFAGDDLPKKNTRNIIGNLINESNLINLSKSQYIGNEAQENKEILNLSYPIQKGIIENWDNMEKMWHHIFYNELKIAPEEHPVLIADSPFNPKSSKEKIQEIMFETFNVSGFYLANSGILTLYSTGRTTGFVFGIGHEITFTEPIYEGYESSNIIDQYQFGGNDLTNYLIKLLKEQDYSFDKSNDTEIARDIKEKLCYCSLNFQQELNQNETENQNQNETELEDIYELKNGDIISISNERIKCCECLFEPKIIGIDLEGIHKLIYNSIMKCDISSRKDFFNNIILTGGTTLFPNFKERLEKEIKQIIPDKMKVKIIADPDRKYSSWIGGSILASLSTFQNMWISKELYSESEDEDMMSYGGLF
ncbi:actin [Anaeramoeba ignava]|uniref:Actin n=1 Tax=Anaeramoeba ignava TaxID=1746090 RepID=A0A9Q0RCF8_ANAIG|nr:actin [Anaeramoeba ignava]